jgi:hypothetical protein
MCEINLAVYFAASNKEIASYQFYKLNSIINKSRLNESYWRIKYVNNVTYGSRIYNLISNIKEINFLFLYLCLYIYIYIYIFIYKYKFKKII